MRLMDRHQPDSVMSEVQIEGEAHLCFPRDGSWFQGHLDTSDHCQFTICGSRETLDSSDKVNDPAVYSVKLVDHDQGTAYCLGQIMSSRPGTSQCQLQSQQVLFQSDTSFGGQKADLMIQHFLPMLVGQNLRVFVGHMKISVKQDQMANKMWTL